MANIRNRQSTGQPDFPHTKPKPWANSNNLIPVAPVLLSFSSNFIGMWRALRCSFLLFSDSILKRVYSNWFRADITLFQWVPCHLELSDLHQEIALMRKTVLFSTQAREPYCPLISALYNKLAEFENQTTLQKGLVNGSQVYTEYSAHLWLHSYLYQINFELQH